MARFVSLTNQVIAIARRVEPWWLNWLSLYRLVYSQILVMGTVEVSPIGPGSKREVGMAALNDGLITCIEVQRSRTGNLHKVLLV